MTLRIWGLKSPGTKVPGDAAISFTRRCRCGPSATLRRHGRQRLRVVALTPVEPEGQRNGAGPSSSTPANPQSPVFGSLERRVADNFRRTEEGFRGDWREVGGCWVLHPPAARGPPKALVHFIGGAFVGAAPQLSYRLLLESLAARGLLIIAAPFPTGFDHLRIADEVHYKLQTCMGQLGVAATQLPVFGLGHSLGSLIHLLISVRYAVVRSGNIFMSFNNRPVTDSIPFFSPFLAPGARILAPILSQLAVSPLRSQIEAPLEALRAASPAAVGAFMPIIDQLLPLYLDVAQGRQEFSPEPRETQRLVRSAYGVPRNLLIRFSSDTIDETDVLRGVLSTGSAVSASLDLTLRELPGDHVRPLQQAVGDLPPEIATVASQAVAQGNEFLSRLSAIATQAGFAEASEQLGGLAKGLSNITGGTSAPSVLDIQLLADEIHSWISLQPAPPKVLPNPGTTAGLLS